MILIYNISNVSAIWTFIIDQSSVRVNTYFQVTDKLNMTCTGLMHFYRPWTCKNELGSRSWLGHQYSYLSQLERYFELTRLYLTPQNLVCEGYNKMLNFHVMFQELLIFKLRLYRASFYFIKRKIFLIVIALWNWHIALIFSFLLLLSIIIFSRSRLLFKAMDDCSFLFHSFFSSTLMSCNLKTTQVKERHLQSPIIRSKKNEVNEKKDYYRANMK